MIHEQINFTPDGRVNLQTYIHEPIDSSIYGPQMDPRPAIIVVTGGGYAILSKTEAEPVALTFLKEGFHTFVLNYTIGEGCVYPVPLEEVSKAIWEVRKRAEEWHIDPNAIVLMGFSAGSSIAGMSATQWNTPGLYKRVGAPDAESIRPNAAVLGYGTSDVRVFPDKKREFVEVKVGGIGREKDPHLNLVDYVGDHVPPLFLWHGREDRLVPADQSMRLAMKMQELRLPYELHVFAFGEHAMSVCNSLTQSGKEGTKIYQNMKLWVTMCTNWLYEILDI